MTFLYVLRNSLETSSKVYMSKIKLEFLHSMAIYYVFMKT